MSTFVPNLHLNGFTTIFELEKCTTVTDIEIEFSVGEEYGSVSVDTDDCEVSVEIDVSDFDNLSHEVVDTILSALVKYYPEHMSKRLFASAPTDADAIKALMERMDNLGQELNEATIELAAIRRAAKMLTVAPAAEQPACK